MSKRDKLKLSVVSVLFLPHIVFFLLCREKKTIVADVMRWMDCTVKESHGIFFDLLYLLIFLKEFRNVFYLRLGFWSILIKWYIRPVSSLYIYTRSDRFGAGTFIQHGFSTVIAAESIGKNCWINQQVTIGYNNSQKYGYGKPVIEDNVRVSCGAKVVGPIVVGKGSTIGVNAVVVKNVPPNSTVVPSPMFLIVENGEKCCKQL